MITDALRIYREWLVHPTTGVNALLPSVPRDATEAPPMEVDVISAHETSWLAKGMLPRLAKVDKPVLLLFPMQDEKGEFEVPLLPEYARGTPLAPEIMIAYVVRQSDTEFPETVVRDSWQTLRTVARVFASHFESTHTRPPDRNQVSLSIPRLRYNAEPYTLGKDLVVASLIASQPMHDRWSLAIGS